MARRVAVIIAVKNVPGQAPLPGAIQGAKDMAAWATAAGWEVVSFTDENGQPLSYQAIFQHIDGLVRSRSIGQLLLYFAGHGQCWGLGADFWLLSGNRTPGDVIDVARTVELARQCGIPEIAVIADACRTVGAANDAAIKLIAFPFFPAQVNPVAQGKVDQFYATMPTQAALEVQNRTKEGMTADAAATAVNAAVVAAHGVFTSHLVKALRGQDDRAKFRLGDGRIVVRPQELADALTFSVPRTSGALAGGFAQRPDCRVESSQLLAEVQAPALCQLRVEARLGDDSPAQGAELELLRHDASNPQLFVSQRKIRSWSLAEKLATGNVYGIRATLDDHYQHPKSPNPVTYLMGDQQVTVTLYPFHAASAGPETLRDIVDHALTTRPPNPLYRTSVNASFIALDDGTHLDKAPRDGVFATVTVDGVTGEQVREPQFVRKGDAPSAALATADSTLRAVVSAATLPGRDHFETETGLTITGTRDVTVYDPSTETGAFKEDGFIHVRGAKGSAPLVLGLGQDRFAALARFEGFIGRVNAGPLGVENVQFLPSAGSRTEEGVPPTADFRRQAQMALAIAETAARHGRFELAIDQARPIAQILRQYKHYNPVLGIFAAYAYHQAGDINAIRDMIQYFNSMHQTVPFDVMLLAKLDRSHAVAGVAPAYPLLTQGWLELGAQVHPTIVAARTSMAPTLWANIVGDAGRQLGEAIRNGELR
ncbi:MAG: caspase family protein [Planctomycetes bacterium]|nr:caspase family protein [Planctomycetota bacterium]